MAPPTRQFLIVVKNYCSICTNILILDIIILFFTDDEGSASEVGKKFTKCSTCKYGAECDEDSEDVWWVLISLKVL